jgi:hypothetical protein
LQHAAEARIRSRPSNDCSSLVVCRNNQLSKRPLNDVLHCLPHDWPVVVSALRRPKAALAVPDLSVLPDRTRGVQPSCHGCSLSNRRPRRLDCRITVDGRRVSAPKLNHGEHSQPRSALNHHQLTPHSASTPPTHASPKPHSTHFHTILGSCSRSEFGFLEEAVAEGVLICTNGFTPPKLVRSLGRVLPLWVQCEQTVFVAFHRHHGGFLYAGSCSSKRYQREMCGSDP